MVKLPKEIGELRNLRLLNLRKNELQEMPLSLTALPRLKVLNYSGNRSAPPNNTLHPLRPPGYSKEPRLFQRLYKLTHPLFY